MKKLTVLALTIACLAGFLSACSKSETQSAVDTGAFEKAFSRADATVKSTADKCASEVKAGNYPGALADLKSLAAEAKLTPEQKQSVQDIVAQVEQLATDVTKKTTDGAGKAATDLQKSLPK